MTPSLEQVSTLYVVVGISSLCTIGVFVLQAIQTFRRQPPVDASLEQKADKDTLAKHFVSQKMCDEKHKIVKTNEQLSELFVTKQLYDREIQQRDSWREEVNAKLTRIDRGVTAIAIKSGVEVQL